MVGTSNLGSENGHWLHHFLSNFLRWIRPWSSPTPPTEVGMRRAAAQQCPVAAEIAKKLQETNSKWCNILWMEEILHHLGWLKPYKQWDKPPINWYRISSIHRRFSYLSWLLLIGMVQHSANGMFFSMFFIPDYRTAKKQHPSISSKISLSAMIDGVYICHYGDVWKSLADVPLQMGLQAMQVRFPKGNH